MLLHDLRNAGPDLIGQDADDDPALSRSANLPPASRRISASRRTSLRTVLRDSAKALAARLLSPHHYLWLAARSNLRRGEAELHLLPQLIDPSRAFFDVGGNIGVYAALAERLTEQVYVFEPHPALADRLRASLRPTSRVMRLAVSDRAGAAVLWAPDELTRCSLERGANGEMPAAPITVQTARLDDLDLPSVGLIKIDVEGHELAVLWGAQATIARDSPALIVEIERRHGGGRCRRTLDFLADLGYLGFFVHRGRVRRLEECDISMLQRVENLPNGARHPDFINNFIYLHRSDRVRLNRLMRNGSQPATMSADVSSPGRLAAGLWADQPIRLACAETTNPPQA